MIMGRCIQTFAAILLASFLALGGVAQAGSTAQVSIDSTGRHETLQRLGDSATLAAAPRPAAIRAAKLQRVSVAGPAPFAALPQLAASVIDDTVTRQLPHGAAAGPGNGRSPPRSL
ncbi:MAG: hypothetical protein JWP63_4422 [Candidatus Solibacter sp.]|jgi:predicted nucleic acid-binding Zn ribbon protein|nr:hypothetical protein [Candidatus Solibacter sp.]